MTQDMEVDRLSDAETARANVMLDLFAPLSISSTWEPSERRTIVRAMLAYGDAVAGITHTIRDLAAATLPTNEADYKSAWEALSQPLSWMHDSARLKAYWGWNLADIANDLIDKAYPGLRPDNAVGTAEGQA